MRASAPGRFPVRLIGYGILALAILLVGYLAVSGFFAYRALSSARSDLAAAQSALTTSPQQAEQSLQSALSSADSAANTLNGPIWSAVSAVPYLGATPKAAGIVSRSLDETLSALQPAFSRLNVLNPASLASKGTIDINALEEAVPVAERVLPGLQQAQTTLAGAPTSGLLLGQVKDAADQLSTQLSGLESTLSTAVTFGKIAGPLLGQNGQKRYFLGLLNPNESRGTGGFLGTYAILTASNGSLSVDEIGSNSDLPNLDRLPANIGREFRIRYGDDPTLVGNMNMSPHFPDSAQIWLASWKAKTGEQLDGAMALDVQALGDLVTASGRPVTLPDGSQMSGDALSRFAIREIYAQFPDSLTRKKYQEATARSALDTVTSLPKPLPMGQALGRALADHRVVVWTEDPAVEGELLRSGIAGSLLVPDGHNVQAVVINASGSKLDAWLSMQVQYDVGRCEDRARVKSIVGVDLRSDVPLGQRPPPYMVGQAKTGPNGPVNFVMLQLHLPNRADINNARVNGKSVGLFEFTEQGRPAAMLSLSLPPRVTERVTFTFTEPASDSAGTLQQQPLASEQPPTIRDVPCAAH